MARVNIEAERARMQMTQAEICRILGITDKTYRDYIRGKSMPSDILEKLRDLTGKPIEYLLEVKE